MFDLAKLDVLKAAEEGRPMTVINPKTSLPFVVEGEGKDKTPLQITLLGRASAIAQDVLKEIEDERSAIHGQGRAVTPDMEAAWNVRYLTLLTRGWNIPSRDGLPFSYSPENAKILWSDPRWPYLNRQALRFVADDGNFLAD
jgi:hypothetical protein